MADHSPRGALMGFARQHFPHAPIGETSSIVAQLLRKWPLREVEAMVKGAALLGWTHLRSVNSKAGLGRRWAMIRYWDEQKKPKHVLESLGQVLQAKGLVK
jgi:hypothetical protein